MNKQNFLNDIEEKIKDKYKKRDNKKKPTMKVSGSSAKKLQKIISNRCK